MDTLRIILILIAFFLGLAFIIHICSKNSCTLKYSSRKRKIEICPKDKSHPSKR